MRERLHAIGGGVHAGERRDHAGRGERRGRLDAPDARVGVRRSYEARVGLAREVDVVAVAARADEQSCVFLAQDRLTEAFAGRAGARAQE